jgi:hypothetical protein
MASSSKPQWNNESKTLDRERPFHRIHYKDFDKTKSKSKADGEGTKCGCTTKEDFPDFMKDFVQATTGQDGIARDFLATLLGDGLDKILDFLKGVPFVGIPAFILSWAKDAMQKVAKKLHPKAIRAIPEWAPVNKGSRNDTVDASQIVEVEGFLTRCYQNAIDPPLFQWHHWFNWSLHIQPEEGYEWVVSTIHNPPSTKDFENEDEDDSENDKEDDERNITQDGSIECQWDGGALLTNQTIFEKGVKDDIDPNSFDQEAERASGPMFRHLDNPELDWAWPMTAQYAWVAGRWVYDCGKSTEPKKEKKQTAKMCTMVNPCKAIATARWEAFKFPENDAAVPAIQFMFFASKRGGYINQERIDDTDYEFIVDLPEMEAEKLAPFPIGHTEDFPVNTIVLRPRLLKHFNLGAFSTAGGSSKLEPIVEVLRPEKPGTLPRQIKITIPLTKLKDVDPGAEAYGVIASLGWHDPNNEQASRVRRCSIQIERIDDRRMHSDPLDDVSPLLKLLRESLAQAIVDAILPNFIPDIVKKLLAGVIDGALALFEFVERAVIKVFKEQKELWLFRVGVNGRWVTLFRQNAAKGDLTISKDFTLLLGEQDRVVISFNGCQVDRIGKVLFKGRNERQLESSNAVVSWKEIAENTQTRRKLIVAYVIKLLNTFGIENKPLGFIDPRIDPGLKITDYNYGRSNELHNPLWMDDKAHSFGQNARKVGVVDGSTKELRLTADFARSVSGPQCVYVEKPSENDYTLVYAISLDKQKLPS